MITPEQRKAWASMGGKALLPHQRSFSQNRQLAIEAGRKGGNTPKRKRLAVESKSADDSNTVPRETNTAGV